MLWEADQGLHGFGQSSGIPDPDEEPFTLGATVSRQPEHRW